MTFEFSSDNDRAYKMFISSEDPVLNEPVKNPKNLLPTKGDYLYNIMKNPTASSRTIELDGRKVTIYRDGYHINVYLGKRK